MAESPSPPSASAYFELSWAILSTIGLANVVHGFMVIGIIGRSRIVFVPITVSAAGALANGLCYYAFYSNYALEGKLAASAFGDFFWLVSRTTTETAVHGRMCTRGRRPADQAPLRRAQNR
jgi:hypothetical protein